MKIWCVPINIHFLAVFKMIFVDSSFDNAGPVALIHMKYYFHEMEKYEPCVGSFCHGFILKSVKKYPSNAHIHQ